MKGDQSFFGRSREGMIISGGEALAHPAFSENLFAAHAEGIHTTIESACFAPPGRWRSGRSATWTRPCWT
ncbi:MAG: hypothetical protein HFF20_09845 [Oscillospiraceae bacterium]|nr:hypothetical protein [Oscillospiraceae bacterium]MCI9549502.1 hypothetical protein [Oscillospiraceae bacterium]